MLCSACIKQKDSSVSNGTQKFTLEQMRLSAKSDVKQTTFHPKVLLEGSPGERCQIDSAGQSNTEEKSANTQSKLFFMKSGSEYEDKCMETLSISPHCDACSGIEPELLCLKTSDGINCSHQMKGISVSGTFTLEETNKLNKDQYSSLCNNLGTKRKLTSTLITFCRRSKRNRDIAVPDVASESETPPAASCSVELKNEKVKLTNSFIGNEEKVCYLF